MNDPIGEMYNYVQSLTPRDQQLFRSSSTFEDSMLEVIRYQCENFNDGEQAKEFAYHSMLNSTRSEYFAFEALLQARRNQRLGLCTLFCVLVCISLQIIHYF